MPRHSTLGASWHTYNVSADVRGSNVLMLGSLPCCDLYLCKPKELAGRSPTFCHPSHRQCAGPMQGSSAQLTLRGPVFLTPLLLPELGERQLAHTQPPRHCLCQLSRQIWLHASSGLYWALGWAARARSTSPTQRDSNPCSRYQSMVFLRPTSQEVFSVQPRAASFLSQM